jgi:hypothetical protein
MIAMCPRPDTHLTYMIDIALTTEFTLAAGGTREAWPIGSSGGRPRWPWPGVAVIAAVVSYGHALSSAPSAVVGLVHRAGRNLSSATEAKDHAD